MKNQRIINLKALAIILVVFGHSIIIYSGGWNLYATTRNAPILDYMKSAINFIQMPLFISISGFLFFYSHTRRNFFELIKIKVRRLIIPFLFCAFCWMLPIRLLIGYSGYKNYTWYSLAVRKIIMGKDNGHLWFLPVLFLIFCVMYWVCLFIKKTNNIYMEIGVMAILLLLAANSSEMKWIPYLNRVCQYLVYFFQGFLLNKYDEKIRKCPAKFRAGMVLLMAAAVCGFYLLDKQYIVSFFLVAILYLLISDRSGKVTDLISENSFGIYLFHSPMVYITYSYFPDISPLSMIGINFFLLGGAAFFLTELLRRLHMGVLIGE